MKRDDLSNSKNPVWAAFFRFPKLPILLLITLLAGGVGALFNLDRQEDPTLRERYGFVLVGMPGADAERIETMVTEPLERHLMSLSELSEIASYTRANFAQVSFEISDELSSSEVEDAWTRINQTIELSRADFPRDTEPPILTRHYIGAASMTIAIKWSGSGAPPMGILRRKALDLQNALQRIPGTKETRIFGLPDEEISIVIDPVALNASGLSIGEAAAAVRAADPKSAAGQFRTDQANLVFEVGGSFQSIHQIQETPLKVAEDGVALRIGDIARVQKGLSLVPQRSALSDGAPAIFVSAYISRGQRIDRWAEKARASLSAITHSVPDRIQFDIAFDQSEYTTRRLRALFNNLVFAAVIVSAVVVLLMGWRSAIVIGSAIPMTVFLVLMLYNFFDHPLHQMSVAGLVISLGLLIDNAIVVVDEFQKLRAKGLAIGEATRTTLKWLSAPLAASTLTTALAFAPIALLPGAAGEFVGLIGVSVIFAVTASFVLSMTILLAVARWLGSSVDSEGTLLDADNASLQNGFRSIGAWFVEGYRLVLRLALRHPIAAATATTGPAVIGFLLVMSLPSQFFPATERDQFQVTITLHPQSTLREAKAAASRATELLHQFDGVEQVHWVLGEPAPRVYYNSFNLTSGFEGVANGWVQLDSPHRTHQLVAKIQREMREAFPDAVFLATPFQQGTPTNAPLEVIFAGPDFGVLEALGDKTRAIMVKTPAVTYTTSSQVLGAPTLVLNVNQSARSALGFDLQAMASQFRRELHGELVGSVQEGTEEIPVRLIASESWRSSLSDIRATDVDLRDGRISAPISAIGSIELEPKTAVISRVNGERVNRVLGYVEPYTLPSIALKDFEGRYEAERVSIPSGYSRRIAGDAENSGEALGNLLSYGLPIVLLIAGSIVLVFNSFSKMLLVVVAGLLSVGYSFYGLILFNLPFGFNSILGSLGLFGIAINGSIVILSLLSNTDLTVNKSAYAIESTVLYASRHILATTLTTIGGLTPIILSGDAFWMPLAATVATGVGGAAMISLFFVPAVFAAMTK
ncbi:MAG: efflux RND transporter permease subunit [Pseudomonadota bacterium]